jgi:bifunctional DNA-binding transcriptional regulator/antitoxin component of YhaV-PrlF toxin-antitoxin module
MAYSNAEQYTLAYFGNQFRVPAVEQDTIGYNDELEVTLYPEEDFADSITFTGYVTSGNTVTIPAPIRRRFTFGDEVTVGFEATGEEWSPEVGASARKAVYESANPQEQRMEAVTDIINSAGATGDD